MTKAWLITNHDVNKAIYITVKAVDCVVLYMWNETWKPWKLFITELIN